MSHQNLTVQAPPVDPDAELGTDLSLADVLRYVDDCHRRALGAMGTAVIAAYEAGMMLHAYRLQFQHGEWEDAVREIVREEGLGITLRTCQRYLQVANVLNELLLSEFGQEQLRDRKTTRATLLRTLRQRELLSINKVLALKKPKTTRTKSRPPQGATFAESDETIFLTPPAILTAVADFFGQEAIESRSVPAIADRSPVVPTLGSSSDDLASLSRWTGNVFIHPRQDLVVSFVKQTIWAVDTGAAEQAVVLVTAEMDAEHAGLLQPYVRGFLRKRPTFETQSSEFVIPETAYMLVHVSRNDDRSLDFADAFGHLADIYYPHRF